MYSLNKSYANLVNLILNCPSNFCSASFEYLCGMGLRLLYIFISFSAGIDFRRQNLTSKVGPRTGKINMADHLNSWLELDLIHYPVVCHFNF